MLNPMDLTGKHILVTGASRGIGRAVCIVASKLGAHVSMAARSEEGLKETYSMLDQAAGGAFYSCDLSNEDEVERLVRDCVGQYGLLDGLVHCAGIPMTVPLKMCNWDKANQLMNINYLPFITFSRMLGNKRFGNSGASIVGISSVAALHGDKVQGLYSATKASIIGLTAPIAKELAVREIRVNNVVFSMVRTDMYYKGFLSMGANNDRLLSRQLLGIIEPEDAAYSVCFLLSDASRKITGTSMVIDGGYLAEKF